MNRCTLRRLRPAPVVHLHLIWLISARVPISEQDSHFELIVLQDNQTLKLKSWRRKDSPQIKALTHSDLLLTPKKKPSSRVRQSRRTIQTRSRILSKRKVIAISHPLLSRYRSVHRAHKMLSVFRNKNNRRK